ncbi:MAG: DUF2752 domain-containing protein [Solobacterium sp.]|nr:DUF2752 domain-containing protein [Solobacterium sp.]
MNDEKTRAGSLIRKYLPVLAAGMFYALWIRLTGVYIPCPFRSLTGYLCPGCGISHCLMSLLRGDIRTAFEANGFVLVLLPPASAYAVYRSCRFIKTGKTSFSKIENVMVWTVLAASILFGVIRNL